MCGHRKEHQGPGFIPKRLIDVHNFRLCEFEAHQRPHKLAYAALSYCWGRQAPLLTKQNNIEEHKQGIRPDQLQKTLLDAATIARELGIGYIWIDALCIIQDSPEDWRIEARQMDRIYTEAALTICATASDPSHGIPGLQGKRLLLPRELDIYGGLKLTTLAPVAKIINSTPWDSRAWTFQERLLSRRCLISTPEGLIWQCKSTTWREDIDASLDKDLWTLDVVGSPLQAIQGNPLRSYTSSAEIYSGRRLTIANDKVVAFEGISGALERRLGSAFEYAMPLRYLDWALLWVEDDKLERNRYLSEIQDVERTKFPSWSWCGWNRRINWPRSFLEGTLFNLRDWFANRTWIIWYIGGSTGWALAWDSNKDLDVTLNRWDGYVSGQSDCYGRSRAAAGCRFKGQVKTGNAPHPEDYPFQPTFEGSLLFQSFTGHFALSRKTMSKSNTQESRLHQFGLADSHGDWCGTVTLDKSWYNRVGGIFEFVAISEAKDFSMDELDTWSYYVSEERHQAEWYCFYALMLECKETDNGLVTERVGLAKIFQSSFFCRSLRECSWKTIVLG